MAQIGSRRTWQSLYADLERSSKGIEYWSALRYLFWGGYFATADVYSGTSDFLDLLTTRPWGGLLLLLASLLWIAALVEHRRLSPLAILTIRKIGCAITLALAGSIALATLLAVLSGTAIPGGYISPLSVIPLIALLIVALLRPRNQYRGTP